MLEPAEELQRDDYEAARGLVNGLLCGAIFWLGVAVGVIGMVIWK